MLKHNLRFYYKTENLLSKGETLGRVWMENTARIGAVFSMCNAELSRLLLENLNLFCLLLLDLREAD